MDNRTSDKNMVITIRRKRVIVADYIVSRHYSDGMFGREVLVKGL